MTPVDVAVVLPPDSIAIISQNGLLSLPWRRFFEAVLKRIGGPQDSVYRSIVTGILGEANFAEMNAQISDNTRLIAELRAQLDSTRVSELEAEVSTLRASVDSLIGQIDASRSSELEAELAALRSVVDGLRGQVGASMGTDADAELVALRNMVTALAGQIDQVRSVEVDAIVEAAVQRIQAQSLAVLSDELRQEIGDQQRQINSLSGSIASLRGDTSAYEDLISGGVTVGKSTTATKWATARALSFTGDATGSGSVDGSGDVATALTLASTGVTAGTYGGSTKVMAVVVDVKGRITGASDATLVAPAGTLTGTTINATVISSSLTALGTLTGLTVDGNTSVATDNVRRVGDYTARYARTHSVLYFGAFPSYTAVDIADKTKAPNVGVGKTTGFKVWDFTNHKTLTAQGSADVNPWYDETGSVSITPV